LITTTYKHVIKLFLRALPNNLAYDYMSQIVQINQFKQTLKLKSLLGGGE